MFIFKYVCLLEYNAYGDQKRASDALELELQAVVNHKV